MKTLTEKRLRLEALSMMAMALLFTSQVGAEPRFAQMYKQHAGYMPSCNACHVDGGGSDLNAYGEAFKSSGSNLGSFAALSDADADADGASNASEILAKSNPGNKNSKPDEPGDWLDTANLIPRDVQKMFPGVTRYKPLDAILTDKEIARAEAMGVELSQQDETTIYIPIGDKKPVGTAIIVPGQHDGKTFFLILATDRQLNVTQARAMHASTMPAVEGSPAFKQVIGKSVQALPEGSDDSLDAHILQALKKAGAILFVRLKAA